MLADVIRAFRKNTNIGLKEAKDFVLWVFDNGTPGQIYCMTDKQGHTAGIQITESYPVGTIVKYLDNGKLARVEGNCAPDCSCTVTKLHCSIMGDGATRYNLPIGRLVVVAAPGTELAECYRLLNAAATR